MNKMSNFSTFSPEYIASSPKNPIFGLLFKTVVTNIFGI